MKKEKVVIRDLSSTGEGVGVVDEKIVFVEGALPKEEVEIEVEVSKKNYSKGRVLSIVKGSPYRKKAPCPYFGVCGGCQIQHAEESLQRSLKKKKVVQALKKMAGIENPVVDGCVPSKESFGYRSKITFPLVEKGGKQVGFFQKRSHDLVDIESCLLHIPFADKIYQQVKEILLCSKLSFFDEKKKRGDLQHLVLRTSSYEKKVLVGIIGLVSPNKELKAVAKRIYGISGVKGVVYGKKSKASNSIYPEVEEVLEGIGVLYEEILGVLVEISLMSFFQVNKHVAELLYQKAFEYGQLEAHQKALDAYCGIGTFATFLAKQGVDVTGIESFPKAVIDARKNAKRNKVDIDFVEGEVESVDILGSFDAVFINPPRKGVHFEVIEKVVKLSPKRIIYTSCDPATLARDIQLWEKRGYVFCGATAFDMFPQTMHVETVALLKKM